MQDGNSLETAPEPALGTEELEAGMRPSSARDAAVIGLIAVGLLLIFNAGGLAAWTRTLPSNATAVWVAERAEAWHRTMQRLGPAAWFDRLRERIRGA